MWKECKIIMLPTINKENAIWWSGYKLYFSAPEDPSRGELYHLYIISLDEEINKAIVEGDWVYENNLNQETKIYQIYKQDGELLFFRFRNVPIWLNKNQHSVKKILACTDSSLVFDNRFLKTVCGEVMEASHNKSLPQIPQQFIEEWIAEYNKGNILEEVEAEHEQVKLYVEPQNYQQYISKPKELQFPVTTNINEVFSLKLSEGNYLSLRRKEKRVYTREEVIKLCKSAYTTGTRVDDIDYFEWERQNL